MRSWFSLLFIIVFLNGFGQKKISFEPSLVHFKIKNAGFNVNGTFGGLEGFVILNNNETGFQQIEGSIKAGTIETGIELRNKHLKKEEYFDIQKYPQIFIKSTKITKTSNNNYTGNFNLTIKDITKSLTIPFTFSEVNNIYSLIGSFSINRLDYKLGEKSIFLSNNVTVNLNFNATLK